jgi:hypothetical protein
MDTSTTTASAGTTDRRRSRRRTRRLLAATAAGVALTMGLATAGSASMSPYVNVTYQNFAAPAADCTAYAGAHMRADKQAQGEAQVPCNLRHAQTVVWVRLVRWNGSSWVPLAWTGYTYNNSLGSGSLDLVTSPSRLCGTAAWYTEVSASVTTGTTTRSVRFINNYQWYDPCA